jgi:hypothetical protein
MLQSIFSSKLSPCTSKLIFLALGVSATLTITSPASAQNSTIIYTTHHTCDNYHEPTVIYQHTRRDRKPHITNFIYGSSIPTLVPVNPYEDTAIPDSEVQSSLKAIPATQIKLAGCCWNGFKCIQC